jgi:hypothetical protein
LVKLRLFPGLMLEEAAAALGAVRRIADRDCAATRALGTARSREFSPHEGV